MPHPSKNAGIRRSGSSGSDRVGFIVTTLTGTSWAVVRFYNQRGIAEQGIKGKTATHWTRLSCHRFQANEVRLFLGVIAYNLGNPPRRLVLPLAVRDWSLTSLPALRHGV
jgi:hypothetical protein